MNLSLFFVCVFCFFVLSVSFRDRGGKGEEESVIRLLGPEQRELLCG